MSAGSLFKCTVNTHLFPFDFVDESFCENCSVFVYFHSNFVADIDLENENAITVTV